jgi:hypothetical protein
MKKDKLVFRRFNGVLWLALVLATGLLFNFNPALGQGTKPVVGLNATAPPTDLLYLPVILKDFGACPQTVCNGDFENGPDGSWAVASSNSLEAFVIINLADYNFSNHSGNYSAWLGGDPAEVTTITQQITLPGNATQLDYWYSIDSNDDCGKSTATVYLDTTPLKAYDLCQAKITDWTKETIAIPANFQGKTLNLIFKSETAPDPSGNLVSSFLLDDVSILGAQSPISLKSPGQAPKTGTPFSSVLRKSPRPSAEKIQ